MPLDLEQAHSFLKVAAVITRDNTHLRLDEALEHFILCWRHTEKFEYDVKELQGAER